ncbi:LOW QUALITY PROTEIN: conserved hypothetical protein, partial [Bacteroides sp. 3_1_23]
RDEKGLPLVQNEERPLYGKTPQTRRRLSYRQQRMIILYLLGLFAAIDLAYIVGGFCGKDKFPIEVQHIQRIVLPQTDSIQPFKNNISNGTIR